MASDWVAEERAWKLFRLVPVMLFRHTGSVGRDELAKRADDFGRGKWTELIEGARGNVHDHYSSVDVVKSTEGWGPEGWGPEPGKKWGPEGWRPRRVEAPKGGGP